MSKPELVSPAGDWAMLTAAINAGADAIYFGLKQLNMRITANNFELSELKKVVDYCHKNKVKAYLCLNTIIYENELEKLRHILREAKKSKVDAVICWDFAVIDECRKLNIPTHLSTQASVSNSKSANFFKKLGVKRIVLARECSLEQIKEIKKDSKVEIEVFVHGAMCVSISGRCLISEELHGKSANRGECIHPCRRQYKIINEDTGKELKIGNNFILSAKDLCALPFLDKLIDLGINAFKIEGRNKNPEYVQVVTECYREIIDFYLKNKKIEKNIIDKNLKKLKTVYNRDFSSGFFLGLPTDKEFTNTEGSKAIEKKSYVGFVKNYYKKIKVSEIKIQNQPIKTGDLIRVEGSKTGTFKQKITSMEFNHKKISKAEKGKNIAVKMEKEVRINDKVFLIISN